MSLKKSLLTKENIKKIKTQNGNLKIINIKENRLNFRNRKCFISAEYSNLKISHFIITRFMVEFYHVNGFPKKIYSKAYINNGIRVMKKYLFPSLENQSCKDFIWILLLGNKANITYIESIINFNNTFEYKIIYIKDINNYINEKSNGANILITTRIDYDDGIYYDAVNDVRKHINLNKPIFLHGYNRGVYYYEFNGKYYDFYRNFTNEGVMSVFCSLIVNLNKINKTYTILQLGDHRYIRTKVIKDYKSFGVKQLNYEPSLFDDTKSKFIYVRQQFSGSHNNRSKIPKNLVESKFNLSYFYGTY